MQKTYFLKYQLDDNIPIINAVTTSLESPIDILEELLWEFIYPYKGTASAFFSYPPEPPSPDNQRLLIKTMYKDMSHPNALIGFNHTNAERIWEKGSAVTMSVNPFTLTLMQCSQADLDEMVDFLTNTVHVSVSSPEDFFQHLPKFINANNVITDLEMGGIVQAIHDPVKQSITIKSECCLLVPEESVSA